MKRHNPEYYYEYRESGMIVCGECLDADLLATSLGQLTGDEKVYQGMYERLHDDQTDPYQCDNCTKQNAAYEALGEDD
jgi:hypothetical protein